MKGARPERLEREATEQNGAAKSPSGVCETRLKTSCILYSPYIEGRTRYKM